MTDKPSSAAYDQTVTLAYNPASRIVTRTGSNDAYAWTSHGSGSTAGNCGDSTQLRWSSRG